MSTKKDWLAILSQATNYGELQDAFASLSVDATTTDQGESIADNIDKAILRIEQERTRDQAELESFTAEYDAFKQQQSGVIGWFKRKLPFTETRKQELGHRDALNDQKAEVLADNFVIARAQILKEKVLPPHLRCSGQPPVYWRNKLLQHDSVHEVRTYGSILHELGQELAKSTHFVESLGGDVEAFANANFSSKEDQLRRNADLLAARGELKALRDEVQEKINLRISALANLSGLVIRDLSENDPDFRTINDRLHQVKELLGKQPKIAKLLTDRRDGFKSLILKLTEWESIPNKCELTKNAIETLQREAEGAERRLANAKSELEGPSGLYQAAMRESQQAQHALEATKPLYNAYMTEQNQNELASDEHRELGASSVVVEYRRLEEVATHAANALRRMTAPFETAKRNYDAAVNESNKIRKQLDVHHKELKKINELENDLRRQITAVRQNIETSFPDLQDAAYRLMNDASSMTWLDATNSISLIQELLGSSATFADAPDRFSLERSQPSRPIAKSLRELQRDAERLENAIKTFQKDKEVTEQELTSLAAQRKGALQRRSQMLLDQSVASELEFQ